MSRIKKRQASNFWRFFEIEGSAAGFEVATWHDDKQRLHTDASDNTPIAYVTSPIIIFSVSVTKFRVGGPLSGTHSILIAASPTSPREKLGPPIFGHGQQTKKK